MFYFYFYKGNVSPLITSNEALVRAKAEEFPMYIFFAADLTTDTI